MIRLAVALALLLTTASTVLAREPRPFTNRFLDGFVLVLWGESRTDDELGRILDRVAVKLHAPMQLVLPWFGCQTDIRSSDVGSCVVNTRPYMTRLAKLAQGRGFEVSFLPIVVTKNWEWRGFFEPRDVDAWFTSYARWMQEVADAATELSMPELVAGSEFTKLYRYAPQWKQLLAFLRTRFAGPLVVTVNWGDHEQGFWDEADAIGVSAYYPLSAAADPTQEQLDAGWAKIRDELVALSRKHGRPVHLTEIGYQSARGAAATPWSAPADAPADPQLQARCFEALHRAWAGRTELARVNVWATEDPSSGQGATGFDPIGKPAEGVLRQFFSERASLRP